MASSRSSASGGQAVTYKAWDPDLKRHIVLKLYHAARSPAQQEMVLKEGQALARVRSPYVAQCHGVERHEGVPYLVIEYIPGRNLAEQHKVRPLDVAQALELTARVAEGLSAVHACGLLHRDLKPANILVGDDGLPRLVDFGLVKPLGDDTLHHISGTLAYMPPEQARGESDRIDARTDLFGLGAVLYHLLTGGPPYRPTETSDLWEAARLGDVIPARQRNPKLPAAVHELCMRCLAKDPTGRFASAAELTQAIRRLQRRRRLPWLATAGAALLVLAGVVLRFGPFHHTPPEPTGPGVEAAPVDTVPRDPDGKALQQDFPLSVKLVGTRKDPAGPLHHITDGQLLSFVIESPQNCYVGIWYQNAVGKITQLFPNDFDHDYLIIAGKPRLIPGENDYQIPAKYAQEPGRMHVIASTEKWNAFKGKKQGPFVVFENQDEFQGFRNFEIAGKTKKVSQQVYLMKVDPR